MTTEKILSGKTNRCKKHSQDSKSQHVYPFWGKAAMGSASYLDNPSGRNKSLIGFGIGAAPRAQIRGLFVSTFWGYRDNLDFCRDCAEIRGSLIWILSQHHSSTQASLNHTSRITPPDNLKHHASTPRSLHYTSINPPPTKTQHANAHTCRGKAVICDD